MLEHVKEQSFSEGGRLLLVQAFAERPGLRRAAVRLRVRRWLGAVDARGCCRARRLLPQGCRPGRLGVLEVLNVKGAAHSPFLRAAPSACISCATSTSARAPPAASALALSSFCWRCGFLDLIQVCLFTKPNL